jgi:hypothetical protein
MMIILIGVIIVAVVLLIYFNKGSKEPTTNKKKIIQTLVRQAARWTLAAQQDQSPLIATLHANYGAGYLWALFDIATSEEIENAAGINVLQLKDNITQTQDNITQKLTKLCPQYVGRVDKFLAHAAGDV